MKEHPKIYCACLECMRLLCWEVLSCQGAKALLRLQRRRAGKWCHASLQVWQPEGGANWWLAVRWYEVCSRLSEWIGWQFAENSSVMGDRLELHGYLHALGGNETWMWGIYHDVIIPWHIASTSLESCHILPQGGRSGGWGYLSLTDSGMMARRHLVTTVLGLFVSAVEPLLGWSLDNSPRCPPSTMLQQHVFIELWLCLERRIRRWSS